MTMEPTAGEGSSAAAGQKSARYATLVCARKACDRCVTSGLTNPARVRGGVFDSDEIGTWTRWNGDLDARLLVVGQDWGDVASFERQRGLDNQSPTNKMLSELLTSVGILVGPAPERVPASGVFLTNAALCLKVGGAQAQVKREWFKNCGESFLRAQIELVRPKVVVSLGERAYLALSHAFDLPPVNFSVAVNRRLPIPLPTGASLVAVYHCGRRILNTHRRREAQFEDWLLVKKLLASSA